MFRELISGYVDESYSRDKTYTELFTQHLHARLPEDFKEKFKTEVDCHLGRVCIRVESAPGTPMTERRNTVFDFGRCSNGRYLRTANGRGPGCHYTSFDKKTHHYIKIVLEAAL